MGISLFLMYLSLLTLCTLFLIHLTFSQTSHMSLSFSHTFFSFSQTSHIFSHFSLFLTPFTYLLVFLTLLSIFLTHLTGSHTSLTFSHTSHFSCSSHCFLHITFLLTLLPSPLTHIIFFTLLQISHISSISSHSS